MPGRHYPDHHHDDDIVDWRLAQGARKKRQMRVGEKSGRGGSLAGGPGGGRNPPENAEDFERVFKC